MCGCVDAGGGDVPLPDPIPFASFMVQVIEASQFMESPSFKEAQRSKVACLAGPL